MNAYLDPKSQAFLRYLDFTGEYTPVVFLAGLGLASTAAFPRVYFEPGLSDHRGILVDLFGCGYSDSTDEFSYTLEEHAASVSSLLDHIGAKPYILVGHSMGGAVAVELAAKRPDLCDQLILAEANLFAGGGMLSKRIADQLEIEFVKTGHQELLDNLRKDALNGEPISGIALGIWQQASPIAMHRSAVSLVKGTQPIMWENLIQLSIPRTFIFGSRSLDDFEEDRDLQKKLEEHNIQVAVVPDAGHAMTAENPAGLATEIAKAIARNG